MEEIKVGEYIRTKYGRIEKVKTVNKYCIITYKTLVRARVEEKINWYSESGREVNEEDIAKHSPNIIDLIEVGDYVNGSYVEGFIEKNKFQNKLIITEAGMIDNKDIKSIVTKENFKNVMYEV